jgi:hypothetical protein
MRAAGAKVVYLSADVCNGEQIGKLINDIYEEYHRLDYVIHGAGIIEDNLIENKSYASFCRVFDTKAKSIFWLTRRLRFETLRARVLFSSVVGRCGNRGQTDYSATNEVMNKIAAYLNQRHATRVVAINWGPWASSGMVSPGVEMQLKERDIKLVPVSLGRKALDAELKCGKKTDVEIVVGDGLWRKFEDAKTALEAYHHNPNLQFEPLRMPQSQLAENLPFMDYAKWLIQTAEKSQAEVTITTKEHGYLFDHRMDRKVVMPLAFVLEIACQAAKSMNPGVDVLSIQDFRAIKGLIIEGSELKLLFTLSQVPGKESGRGRKFLDVQVALSEKPKLITHKGIFCLGEKNVKGMLPSLAEGSAHAEPFPFSMETLYDKLLFHGPSLRTIQSISGISEKGIAAVFKTSRPRDFLQKAKKEFSWISDPVIMDGISQLASVWLTARHDVTCFPAGFNSLNFYNNFPEGPIVCELRMKSYTGGASLRVDAYLKSMSGVLLAQIEDFEFSSSKTFNRFRGTYEPVLGTA